MTIRCNMTSSTWIDVPALVAAHNAFVLDPLDAGVPSADFSRLIEEIPDNGPETCTIWWAVVIGEEGRLNIQLQTLST